MSVIIAKGEQITQCAYNNSTSHQMYSFGIGKRFADPKINIDSYYIPPSSFSSNKGFSMGSSNRNIRIFNKKKENQPKTYYYEESSFSKNLKKNNAPKMVVPNKSKTNILKDNSTTSLYDPYVSLKNASLIKNIKSNDTNKSFDNISSNWKTNLVPSLKGKPKSVLIRKDNGVPGPGQYKLNSSFSIYNNKISNTSFFFQTSSKRFKYSNGNQVPGPIYDNEYKNISYNLKKIIENRPKSSVNQRLIKNRLDFYNPTKNYPGPGEYIKPSDFGIYQSKYAKEKIIYGYKILK